MEGGKRRRSRRRGSSSEHQEERKKRTDPTIEYKLRKIAKEAEEKNEEVVDEYLKNNDLTDLVSPYIYDNVQMNVLKYILGSQNADSIAGLNALNYAGVINTSCPPPKEPWKTESYKNIITGKLECREPIPRRTENVPAGADPLSCPSPSGDPMAVQKYIDMYGQGHCVRPVVSGQFSCPPKNDPTKTKLKVLKNNVGVCVKDPMLTRKKNLMPNQLVYVDKLDPNALKYLEVYNDERLTLQQIGYLNDILRKSKTMKELGDIKAGLSGDYHYESLVLILDNIHRKNDINYAQSALGCYLRDYIKDNKTDVNVKDLLKVSGLEDALRYNM